MEDVRIFSTPYPAVLAIWLFAIALMMEAAGTFRTSVNVYQTTRRYNPEDSHLHGMFITSNTRATPVHSWII
jgi:hypothetical protein